MLPPQTELLTKQLNYKSMQRPDKKGKPIMVHSKAAMDERDNEMDSDIIEYTKVGSLDVNRTLNTTKNANGDIRTNNVSRPANQDANIIEITRNISGIKPKVNVTQSEVEDISLLNQTRNTKTPNAKDGRSKVVTGKTEVNKTHSKTDIDGDKKLVGKSEVELGKTTGSVKDKLNVKSFKKDK